MLNELFIVGFYCGIIVIMFFYNLFIYITTEDRNYLYYIVYILSVGFAQLVLNGFAQKYFWPDNLWFETNSVNVSGVLSGISTALFCQSFLQTKKQAPGFHKAFNVFIALYTLSLLINLSGYHFVALNMINVIATAGSCFAIITGIYLVQKRFLPAAYFLLAFSIFLIAVILYVLRTVNILPYNNLTAYVLEIGSVIQITLLSFALANKINTYRKEEATARREALNVSKENERLVREQNIVLEKEVKVRTSELEKTNLDLSQTLLQLKTAQSKLVESEKMASLGQLTAGIAHEINNPINFVASNVKPLELDIQDIFEVLKRYETINMDGDIQQQLQMVEDYKRQIDVNYIGKEIKSLLDGIKEGALRTAEIVKNLKNFVRLDQSNLKLADLNEGLESTLLLVRNAFPTNIVVKKDLGKISLVECAPGKINQVFMNIITNGIQAIKAKKHEPGQLPTLTICSIQAGSNVKVSIKDNGTGMSSDVINKIYEPFFTTKDVGEGTGLGMSIVKGIIDSHHGDLEIKSTEGEGTEFILTLPVVSPNQ